MLALTIIALLLSIVSLAVGILIIFRVNSLVEQVEKENASLENEIRGLKLDVADLSKEEGEVVYQNLDCVSYDPKTSTITVKGNLHAEGWMSCGVIKKED